MKKVISLVLILMMVCVVFSACSNNTTPSTAPSTAASTSASASAATVATPAASTSASTAPASSFAKTYNVVDVVQSMSNESQSFALKMFQKHAADSGFNLTYMDSKADPATEAQNVSTAVAQGAKAIFVNPNDIKGIVPSLMAAKQAGVVIGMFSSDLGADSQQYRDFYCGANDEQAGEMAAQAFIKQFPNGAKIVEIGGQSGHDAQIKRHDGFEKGLKGSNITVLETKNCAAWDTNDAMNIMQDFITKYGDKIQGVFCHWDNGMTGVIQAMTNGKMDPTKIYSVAIDGCKAGFDQVKAGTQTVCLMQDFETMASTEMKLARTVIDGGKVDTQVNYIPWGVVTKDTISNFTYPEW